MLIAVRIETDNRTFYYIHVCLPFTQTHSKVSESNNTAAVVVILQLMADINFTSFLFHFCLVLFKEVLYVSYNKKKTSTLVTFFGNKFIKCRYQLDFEICYFYLSVPYELNPRFEFISVWIYFACQIAVTDKLCAVVG